MGESKRKQRGELRGTEGEGGGKGGEGVERGL